MRPTAAFLLFILSGPMPLQAQLDTTGVKWLQLLPVTTDTTVPAVVLRSEVDGGQFRLALNPLLTLADVAYAFAHEGSDTAQKVVAIQLTPEGRRRFAEATERLIGHQLGVVLGGRLLQVPGVRSALMGPVPVTDLPVPAADADALIRRLNELARGNK